MIFVLKISELNTLWQANPPVFAQDFQDCNTKIVVVQCKSKIILKQEKNVGISDGQSQT